jgi:hypothetical protein
LEYSAALGRKESSLLKATTTTKNVAQPVVRDAVNARRRSRRSVSA